MPPRLTDLLALEPCNSCLDRRRRPRPRLLRMLQLLEEGVLVGAALADGVEEVARPDEGGCGAAVGEGLVGEVC